MAVALLQVGLLVKDQLVALDAARAGARQAAVSADDAAARQAVVDAAASLDPSLLDVSIARETEAGSPVTLSVVYHAPISLPLVAWLFPTTVDVSASAVMRQEFG
jgi:hypothetical protein